MVGVAFVVAVIAVVAAVVFWFQAQSAASVLSGLKTEAQSARADADVARAQLRDAQAESKARSQQLVELRERLADVKKRVQQSVPQKRGAREAELEEDLVHARRLVEETHAAEQVARRDAVAATAEAATLRAELERAQQRARDQAARAAEPVPVPVAPPADDARLREAESRRADAEGRIRDLERALKDAREKERTAREDLKKARGRAETNNRVFLVTKGELEVTRERLAQAEKALWKAGLQVPTAPAKERPRATGPAAIDRPRPADAASAISDAEHGPAPSEGQRENALDPTPAEPPSAAAEPISAAAEQPMAVPPLRRRPQDEEGEPAQG